MVLIIIHFGRNPVKGGRPAKDNNSSLTHSNRVLDVMIDDSIWVERVNEILCKRRKVGAMIST